uniref:C-type lectin domain-containing protein n=1 Tax=Stegastes partitus TaxID=144197 RepID=A0A3B5ADQ8_9TELE
MLDGRFVVPGVGGLTFSPPNIFLAISVKQLHIYPDLTYGEYCYIFFTESERWANAAASCVRHGKCGMLASIEDSFEQDFIARNVKTFHDSYTSFWMGLFKNTKEEWLWLDRTVMDYTNWREEQFDSNYGEISTSDGTWKADHGFYERPYICKTPKGKTILFHSI